MKLIFLASAAAVAGYLYYTNQPTTKDSGGATDWPPLGDVLIIHNGVPVYSNGEEVYKSNGKHYAADGYYYGHKWQCVEFIKRYYYDAHQHKMPNVWGHAKDYFSDLVAHGQLNPDRNMIQFQNSNNVAPRVDDLIVWGGNYGHVAIVSEVHSDHVIIVQQNVKYRPSAKLALSSNNGTYTLGSDNQQSQPKGWLRIAR